MQKGYLYIAVSTILFSTMEIALKFTGGMFNPVQITFLRFLIGSLVLLPLTIRSLKARQIRMTAKDYTFYAMTGFLCVVVSMILFQLAVVYGQPSVVAVLFSCNPVFVIVFAYFLLGEPITKYTIASLVFSIAGIIVIMNPAHIGGNELSAVLILSSAVIFALYGVLGRKQSALHGGVALTSISFLFGSGEMLVLILLTKLPFVAAFFRSVGLDVFAEIPIFQGLTFTSLPLLMYIGVGVTGIGYAAYFLAMEATTAAEASLVFFIKPILAPIFSLLILGTAITFNMSIGIVLILLGSALSLVPKLKQARAGK